MKPWEVISVPFNLEEPSDLADTLSELHAAGNGVFKVVHHRRGRDFDADIIYHQTKVPLPAGRFVCEVALLDDPEAFAAHLNRMHERGVVIGDILQHRVQNEMRAAIIGFLPDTPVSLEDD